MSDTTAKPAASNLLNSVLLVLFGLLVYGLVVDDGRGRPEDALGPAQKAVLTFFNDKGNWGRVECRSGRSKGFDTLYCHPSGNTRQGGLYIITQESGQLIVYPINGTGIGQMRNRQTLRAADGRTVIVREWAGSEIDIRAAIDATL